MYTQFLNAQKAYEDNRYSEALFMYCEVIEIFKYYDNYSILGISYNNIGNIQYNEMKFNESLQYYQNAVQMAYMQQKQLENYGIFTELNETKQTDSLYNSQFNQNQQLSQIEQVYHNRQNLKFSLIVYISQ
ncbi:hypothetical protein PPERSA_00621 [Pseudocohnilembus persalinus]|uniref:Tetratricopeptide repeat protein n=1 Tax=Pseudocohnilembus persalinus TaxID=266149 RepID=A0A0V0QTR6_PSEPJ|nr:hypothetical protein PPERSA_00621 [Pseudocohnilembus persalinus]|eukprot:KRX05320.1 hypothetical protein PPERSA_00621 [Pseudocohnilembus persalinus]